MNVSIRVGLRFMGRTLGKKVPVWEPELIFEDDFDWFPAPAWSKIFGDDFDWAALPLFDLIFTEAFTW